MTSITARTQPRKPPPRQLKSLMNVALRLRSPLHGLVSENVLLFTFAGKSGKRCTTPLRYVRVGGEILMSTGASWWKNLRRQENGAGAPVSVLLKGRTLNGAADAVTDEEGVVEGLSTILAHGEHLPGLHGERRGTWGRLRTPAGGVRYLVHQ